MKNPFQFYTRLNSTELLGVTASNLTELLEGIKNVSGSSIYHHTHRFLQQHHFLSPEPPNDFAYWIGSVLQEDKLGEQLAAVDIVQFKKIADLRREVISIIETHLKKAKSVRVAPEGEEFHFMKSITFIMPTPYVAHSLEEFYTILEKVSVHSIYFHIFEARLRLEKGDNDFSEWLGQHLDEHGLAAQIAKLDPYTQTLEDLRKTLCRIVKARIDGKNK
ncbi:MAG: hypothetical protein JW983_09210 [Elusimicrobia bacterium]|nr:hypothetical protein [Elusimicrobiota bacterium]